MSKLLMFDFECPDGHLFEELQQPHDLERPPCPDCGNLDTKRVISAVRLDYNKMAMQSGFTTAVDKWDKGRRQRLKKEKDDPNLLMY